MASTGATGLDVITTGAAGPGRIAEPRSVAIPGGFGNGCKSGDEADEASGVTGGCRGKTLGASAIDSAEGGGVIFGGNRRMGVTGVREGKTIRVVSCFATLETAAACSGRGGSAMRTISFFGSAMRAGVGVRPGESHKSTPAVTR
jgi:hypothetical protein